MVQQLDWLNSILQVIIEGVIMPILTPMSMDPVYMKIEETLIPVNRSSAQVSIAIEMVTYFVVHTFMTTNNTSSAGIMSSTYMIQSA